MYPFVSRFVAEQLNELWMIVLLSQPALLVMFSAAVPGQGGSHHINGQWSAYWRSLFAADGFRLFDPIPAADSR